MRLKLTEVHSDIETALCCEVCDIECGSYNKWYEYIMHHKTLDANVTHICLDCCKDKHEIIGWRKIDEK